MLRSLNDDILDLRNAVNILDTLIKVTDDDNLLVYDLEECVQCD